MNIQDTHACLILNALKGIGPITFSRIMDVFEGYPSKIFTASLETLHSIEGLNKTGIQSILGASSSFNLQKELNFLASHKAQFINSTEDHYPPLLKNIPDPPIGLYTLGTWEPTSQCIAIIGSRRTSLYGMKVARELAAGLASKGIWIISGLASGIDSAAHEGALSVGGKTAAILGSGLNVIYPPENKALYHQIAHTGAIFSEFTFDRRGDKQTFPMRNRIISGMSLGVIVVETDMKGGSMITARMAAEQGRQVYAVPNRIDQQTSHGCHQLIREGATLLTCIDDILEDLAFSGQLLTSTKKVLSNRILPTPSKNNLLKNPSLSSEERSILRPLIELGPLTIEALSKYIQCPTEVLCSQLVLLELNGHIIKKINGTFEITV